MRWLLGTCFLRKWFSGFSLIRLCSLAMCVALSACTTPDPASPLLLRDEVAPLVKNGMPLADAIATLRSRSFSCMEGTSLNPRGKGIFECTRSRGPWWPPYSCMKEGGMKLLLAVDPRRQHHRGIGALDPVEQADAVDQRIEPLDRAGLHDGDHVKGAADRKQ